MPLDLALLLGRRADFVWRELHWPAELAPEVAAALLRQLGTDQFVCLIAFELGREMARLVIALECRRRR